jgi:hypothetical protein
VLKNGFLKRCQELVLAQNNYSMPNQYDRIIKENFREPTKWLLKRLTGIQSIEILPVQSKLQRTLEKEGDMFFLVTPKTGLPFIVHIEWQVKNDKTMPARMLFYHVLLAVLAGKTKKEEKREIIQKILAKLQVQLKDDAAALSRKLVQLEILGDLRNVQNIIIEEENKMATLYELYDIKRDLRYKQGKEDGIEKTIRNLLLKTKHSLKEIAEIVDVPLTFVETIKKQLV